MRVDLILHFLYGGFALIHKDVTLNHLILWFVFNDRTEIIYYAFGERGMALYILICSRFIPISNASILMSFLYKILIVPTYIILMKPFWWNKAKRQYS